MCASMCEVGIMCLPVPVCKTFLARMFANLSLAPSPLPPFPPPSPVFGQPQNSHFSPHPFIVSQLLCCVLCWRGRDVPQQVDRGHGRPAVPGHTGNQLISCCSNMCKLSADRIASAPDTVRSRTAVRNRTSETQRVSHCSALVSHSLQLCPSIGSYSARLLISKCFLIKSIQLFLLNGALQAISIHILSSPVRVPNLNKLQFSQYLRNIMLFYNRFYNKNFNSSIEEMKFI